MYSAAKAAADFAHLRTARGWKLRPCKTEAQPRSRLGRRQVETEPQPEFKTEAQVKCFSGLLGAEGRVGAASEGQDVHG
jgi:hypothetical protein